MEKQANPQGLKDIAMLKAIIDGQKFTIDNIWNALSDPNEINYQAKVLKK